MLGRFFVIHFILPFVIVVATVFHIRTVQSAFAQAMKKKFSEKESRSLLFDYKITDLDAIKITLFFDALRLVFILCSALSEQRR